MDWNEAVEEAKENLGYCTQDYVNNWESVVEEAKEILEAERVEDYEEFCDEAYARHKYYLNSDKWKRVRQNVLKRDNYKCVDCKAPAVNVHHLDYNFMSKEGEEDFCISLCRYCHKDRHGLIKHWKNSHEAQYPWEYV